MATDECGPDTIQYVLQKLGLLEDQHVERVATEVADALGPGHAKSVARLLVVCLEAHHRMMIRSIAGRIGEGLQNYASLRELVGLEPLTWEPTDARDVEDR